MCVFPASCNQRETCFFFWFSPSPCPSGPSWSPPVIEAYQAGMYSMARLNRTAARLMTKYGKFSVLVSLCNWWRDCAIMLSYCAMPLPCCEITLPCRCPLCNRCDRIWHTWPCSQPSQGPEGRRLLQAPLPSKYAYLHDTPFRLHTSAVCSYACLPWNLPQALCSQYHQYYCDCPPQMRWYIWTHLRPCSFVQSSIEWRPIMHVL